MMITPFLIVPVAAALLWKHALYNPEYGLFNGVLRWVGNVRAELATADWISQARSGRSSRRWCGSGRRS